MLRFLTTGESHGPALVAVLEGMPAGLKLNIDQINEDMWRRQQGYGRGNRQKIEKDKAEIIGGGSAWYHHWCTDRHDDSQSRLRELAACNVSRTC